MRPALESPRTRPVLAGLLAVLGILLGILGEGVHLALESHRWCELHGAMEHGEAPVARGAADAHCAEDAARATEREEAPADGPVLEGDASPEPSKHELCRLLLAVREVSPLLEPTHVRAPAPEPRTEPLAARTARPHESVARLRLAPKNSPPVG